MFVNVGMVGRIGGVSGGSSGGATGPSLDMQLAATGALDSRVTFTRAAGPATYFDSSGVLQSAGTNVPRFDYDPVTHVARGLLIEEARTNVALQSAALDNAAWSATTTTVTPNIDTAPDGTLSADRLAFTASGASSVSQTLTLTAASYTLSCWLRAASGTEAARLWYFDGTTNLFSSIFTITTTWQRFSFTTTGTAVVGVVGIRNSSDAAARSVFAWGFQTELGAFPTSYIPTTTVATTRAADVATMPTAPASFSRASTATYFDVAGTMQTAAIDVPRYDYDPVTHAPRGLLLEGARTNAIRNNSGTGIGAGSPGTTPGTMGFVSGSVNGLTRTIALGTEGGMPYIDYTWAGTTNNTTGLFITFEPAGTIAAIAGQTWSLSTYMYLVAGAFPAGTPNLHIDEYNSVPTFLTFSQTNIVAGGPTLAASRQTHTRTLNQPSTAFVAAVITIPHANGVVVNFTLRVALAQMELSASATSAIPTTGIAVTRAADVVTGNWFNPAVGTLAVDLMFPQVLSTGSNIAIAALDTGATTDTIEMRQLGVSTLYGASTFVASVNKGGPSTVNSFAANVLSKAGMSYNYGSGAISIALNGGVVVSATPTALPTGIARVTLGSGRNTPLNGWISRVRYWPTALSNADLQSYTS